MSKFIVWQASGKKKKKPSRSDLVSGFQVLYKVENKVTIELHFECVEQAVIFDKKVWQLTEHSEYENVFILSAAEIGQKPDFNGFNLEGNTAVPVWHDPVKKVSADWKVSAEVLSV